MLIFLILAHITVYLGMMLFVADSIAIMNSRKVPKASDWLIGVFWPPLVVLFLGAIFLAHRQRKL